ncbi:MAG: lactate racemase domain-containing protein, partial [Candidatus Kariarchaeaceae archaeon]
MLPNEINLPSSSVFFESEHPPVISDKELMEILKSDIILDLLREPSIIIINDHHRSTPSGRILRILAKLYASTAKVDYIVIAGGTHEEPTDEQLTRLTSRVEEIFDCEILIHDPLEEEVELVYLGVTSRGTDVKVHPVLLDYENILCINSVEPHYFAGFTGGVKSIIPGLAAKSTVEQNHAWALSEESGPTLIEKNPLQQDLREGLSLLDKVIHGIQIVNFQNEIFHISVGELERSFEDARAASLEIYARKSTVLFDIIVSIVYPPLDRSLYQAQKGIENTRQILKPGGEMILVAKCEKGIGNSAFFDRLNQFSSPSEVMEGITIEEYKFGDHKAFKFASLASTSKIVLAGELTPDEATRVFATAISMHDLEDHLQSAAVDGKNIAVVLDSGAL